jgi:ubiquinol-cytochrome c reductase iron-sulfur subunit
MEPAKFSRRSFVGLLTSLATGIAAVVVAVPFIKYFLPSERAKAIGGPLTVDISDLGAGELKTVLWRGRAIWLLRRTPEMLATLPNMTPHLLDTEHGDPESQPPYVDSETRSIDPEYLVIEGVCTHLGCVPNRLPNKGDPAVGGWWQGGFFCPCHRSAYDYAGRVVQRPAPNNLRVPRYRFAAKHVIVIGEDPSATPT